MGRLEVQDRIGTVEDLQVLINRVKSEHWEAVYVPPMFVETAAAMLGRHKATIVTTTGRDEDILETKLMGLEAAVKAGAGEVIVSVPQQDILDDKWDHIEKELFQLGMLAGVHNIVLWVGCRFGMLNRRRQVSICEALPKGYVGLRIRGAALDDVQLAKICGVDGLCVAFAGGILGGNSAPEAATLQTFQEAGATQFTLVQKPEQIKADPNSLTIRKMNL